MKNNDELLNIIKSHDKLIHSIVNKIKGHYDRNDLYQVGVIGLIKAYRNYKEEYGAKFSTYAFSYILGEMKKYTREDKGIKISRDMFKLNNKIEQVKDMLSQKLMREPSTSELSKFLEIDEYEITNALSINNYIQSLDVPTNNDGKELNLYDNIKQEEVVDIIDKISLKEQLESLSEKDQKLIQMRYINDQTQTEVANILGLTQVQVSRREQKVLTRLRINMGA